MQRWIPIGISICLLACGSLGVAAPLGTVGQITRWDPALDAVVDTKAPIEKLAEGYTWSEGPVWVEAGGYLLFNDVPENVMYRWSERDGAKVFLKPSGYAGRDTAVLREAGANGMFPESAGKVLVANAGNRTVDRLDLKTKQSTVIAKAYEGRRFNSPNDLVRRSDGVIFFTDPPYSLKGLNDSPVKELSFNGVYRIDVNGAISVIDKEMTFPNGIALSPDERTLYVANSDPKRPIWMAYSLDKQGNVESKRVFADASDLMGDSVSGLPDGLRVATDGHIFATGPGGVLVFSADGKRLGRIETGTAIANCAFGEDGRVLYMTSDSFLARVRVKVAGYKTAAR